MPEEHSLPFEVRAATYALLARLFLAPPDADLLSALSSPDFLAEWPLYRGDAQVEEGLRLLAEALPNAGLGDLATEYRDLFFGPGPVLAPPWESVYLDREHLVFGEETLQVRQLFRRFGLESRTLHAEPDDHIGLMVQFMAQLSARCVEAAGVELLEGQRECLEHLLKWVPDFAERVRTHARSPFYPGAALIALGTFRQDLEQVQRWLKA